MSLGIALLIELAKKTAAAFPEADIEIVETHHNRKVDAPSGTALSIGKAIQEIRTKATFLMGRSGMAKRTPQEIASTQSVGATSPAFMRSSFLPIHRPLP